MEKWQASGNCWSKCIMGQPLWKIPWFPNLELPSDLAVPLPSMYHTEVRAEAGLWAHTPVWLIAAEASVIPKGRSKTCPSVDKWTNRVLDLHRDE